MKRKTKLIMSVLMAALIVAMAVTFTACSEDEPKEGAENHELICVDIGVDGGGYYALMSDVEIGYSEGGISYIFLDDPTLLAFAVSDRFDGGVCLVDGDDMAAVMEMLEDVKAQCGDDALIANINAVIEILESYPATTGAST